MSIVGHQKIMNFLEKSLREGKISHAYIFSGARHLGKKTIAIDFAKKIIGKKDQEINPDLIIISPEKEEKRGVEKEKDIKIEKIRELERELSLSPYFGQKKVAIIESADKLTFSAQNSLLKTLEEPPQNCVIILIVSSRERILPTIWSRCLNLRFNLVKRRDIEKIISQKEKSEEIAFWSMGRPGFAYQFIEKQESLSEKIAEADLLKKIAEADLSARFKEAETLSKNPKKLLEILSLWTFILRENIFQKKILPFSKKKSLILIEEIEKISGLVQKTNSNSRILMENLFLKF